MRRLPAWSLADHGVAVNAALQSSDPDIYAVGDIAAHDHPRYDHRVRVEHWAWAKDQGAHVAGNLMGGDDPYELRPFFFSDQYDLGYEYRGLADPARDELVLRGDLSSREFTAFWLRAGGVVAAMNVNQWDDGDALQAWSTPAAHSKTNRYPTATVVPTKELQMSASLTSTAPVPAASGVAAQALTAGAATIDRIRSVKLSSITLPLATPISDAKVFTGRQKAMTEVALLFAEIRTEDGHEGIGFSYSKRAGGPGQFAHAQEIAPVLIGEDPSDIGKIWTKLVWAGASVGRSGLATQSIAAMDIALWDLKAKRANLPLAKLLGAHRDSVRTYNTSGGFLQHRSSRSSRIPPMPCRTASAASRSRSGNRTGRPTSLGSSVSGSIWVMTFR